MPWVSNKTDNDIVVALTADGQPGAIDRSFIVRPASAVAETAAANFWPRHEGASELRLTMNGVARPPFNVAHNRHVNIYVDKIELILAEFVNVN
jgi:hypothetical protein